MNEILKSVLQGALNVALVLALAPLFEGILRKVTARIQSRQGPPVIEPYLDILKLLGKEDIESGVSPRLQRFAAYLSLASVLATALLVPMGTTPPLDGSSDAILLIYLLTLCGISTLLAALAAGSVYSLMGMSREMMAMMTLEPILAVSIVAGALRTGSLRLGTVLDGSVYAGEAFPLAGLLLFIVGAVSLQAFVGRTPFDIAEAETEIMEGPFIEYSGPKLALFKYAQMAKLMVYATIFTGIFLPWGNGLPWPLGLAAVLAKVLVLVLVVTLLAATHARYRIDQAVRYYGFLFGVLLVALFLTAWGF